MNEAIIEQVKVEGRVNPLMAVQAALSLLKEVTISGYIPFTSPCPSSMEMIIREHILNCISETERIITLMDPPRAVESEDKFRTCDGCRYCKGGYCIPYDVVVHKKSMRTCFEPKD